MRSPGHVLYSVGHEHRGRLVDHLRRLARERRTVLVQHGDGDVARHALAEQHGEERERHQRQHDQQQPVHRLPDEPPHLAAQHIVRILEIPAHRTTLILSQSTNTLMPGRRPAPDSTGRAFDGERADVESALRARCGPCGEIGLHGDVAHLELQVAVQRRHIADHARADPDVCGSIVSFTLKTTHRSLMSRIATTDSLVASAIAAASPAITVRRNLAARDGRIDHRIADVGLHPRPRRP